MREALRAADELRVEMGTSSAGVFGRVHPRNEPSIRLLEQFGFDDLGVFHIEDLTPGPIKRHRCVACPRSFMLIVPAE